MTCLGLSPRVRGSHSHNANYRRKGRSIPASAGQPGVRYVRRNRERVYPRECGAALLTFEASRVQGGLSPRVRGSPH